MTDTPIKILLVEDNREHQHLLLLALTSRRPQVNVTVVESGAEFLRALKLQPFDCAILDFNLPDYSADELLSAAREDLKDCPAVVISSSSEQEIVISSIRSGGIDFVCKEKAVVGDELWTRVEHAIALQREKRRDRRRAERRQRYLSALADHDPLTGLYNRRYVEQCFEKGRWKNDRREAMSCAMIDVDHFKQINDMFGHNVGDAVLKDIAALIRNATGGGDIAVRWGGEEFLIAKSQASIEEAWLWAEALRRTIESHTTDAYGARVHLTASIGLTQCPSAEFGIEAIEAADKALYLAKDQGRNMVCTADMVGVVKAIAEVSKVEGLVPEQRREALLKGLEESLGPTQREHLTDHSEAVSRMAVRLGEQMKLAPDEVERLRVAALVHDIGKCIIPEGLLAKPRSLSVEEWRVMARHESYGVHIARQLGIDEPTVSYIDHLHRRYDENAGQGAAAERSSAEVPLGARVLCVADALVTMLSHRKYRPARPLDCAMQELRRERGRQFAPDVVDAAASLEPAPELVAA